MHPIPQSHAWKTRGRSLVLASFSLIVACEGRISRQQNTTQAPEHNVRDTSTGAASQAPRAIGTAAPAASVNATSLTLDSLPQPARAALAAGAPGFEPWPATSYALVRHDSARVSRDEGLSIVRGRFRSPDRIDYVIAGYDRRLHGLRTVALLAQADGAFKVISVSDGPEAPDSLAMRPDRYLAVDTTRDSRKVYLITAPLMTGPDRGARWLWVPERGQFLLDEPQ